jgi:hypothetical protein
VQRVDRLVQPRGGTTKSEAHLAIGKQVQCCMEKDHMFIPDEKGKEVKYSIVGASEAQ